MDKLTNSSCAPFFFWIFFVAAEGLESWGFLNEKWPPVVTHIIHGWCLAFIFPLLEKRQCDNNYRPAASAAQPPCQHGQSNHSLHSGVLYTNRLANHYESLFIYFFKFHQCCTSQEWFCLHYAWVFLDHSLCSLSVCAALMLTSPIHQPGIGQMRTFIKKIMRDHPIRHLRVPF